LELFEVVFSQFAKTEIDYIRHWKLSENNVLAMRSFVGLAVPFGNSNSIPFSKSYFSGGSNDNRAWDVYRLGPGSSGGINEFNEANFKLAFNLEYRFGLFGSLGGALFTDIGNIWNVFDNDTDPKRTFGGFDDLSELAIGTGFGLRYDFNYLVLRLDAGFKTYNPALEKSARWNTQYKLKNAVFNIGINYPF
jgi:outer membrane protein assembly factor BamA